MQDPEVYCVKFVFLENGRERTTSWIGPAKSPAEAERKAREWFGFEKDHIEVLSVEIS